MMLQITAAEELADLIREKPDFKKLLKLVLSLEEVNKQNSSYLGWSWGDILCSPSMLTYLMTRDVIRVGYKSGNYTHYRLTDPELVKKALTIAEQMELASEQPLTIPEDFFDIIVGFQDVKDTITRSLKAERPVHILLVGPPATGAKTLFMDDIRRLPGARYTLGSTDTKAGITHFLLDYRPRILMVDEIDKMTREDYSALLSLMETGIVTEMKFRRMSTIQLKCWVFGAANDVERIPAELKSRFLVFHVKPYGEADFIAVVTKALQKREGTNEQLASFIASQLAKRTKDPRVAVKIARLCKTEEEVLSMIKMMIEYRSL